MSRSAWLSLIASIVIAGCTAGNEPVRDQSTGLAGGKADSPVASPDSPDAPTHKGSLASGQSVDGGLTETSGFHGYSVEATAGAELSLELTASFPGVVALVSPSGDFLGASDQAEPLDEHRFLAKLAFTADRDGTYLAIVTSQDDLDAGAPGTVGEYSLRFSATQPGGSDEPGEQLPNLCPDRTGGALVSFRLSHGDLLTVWVTNRSFIARAQELLATGEKQIPVFGKLLDGADCDRWSWHVDPEQVSFADFATEVCDAWPTYIEDHKDAWFEQVGHFCPWDAHVIQVLEQ